MQNDTERDQIGRSKVSIPGRPLSRVVTALGVLVLSLPSLARPTQAAPLNTLEIIERARELRRSGHGKVAVELLKRARQLAADDEDLAVFLAWTYWSEGNRIWALKTATEFAGDHKSSCMARGTAVWLHIQMASLTQAESLLSESGCDATPEDSARLALLRATLAKQQNKPVRPHIAQAQTRRLYAEDAPLLDQWLEEYEPGRTPLVTARLDMAAGWTSNGLSGSPVDSRSRGDHGSALVAFDGRTRVVYPALQNLRPVVTAQIKLSELFGAVARDLSYEQPSLRAGLLWGKLPPTLLLSYAVDAIRLHAGDRYAEGPVWFSEAHRLEWESQLSDRWSLFGGSGYRWFRDIARSRFEFEQGVVTSWTFGRSLRLLGAMSMRWQQAHSDGYDLVGGTTISEVNWTLGPQTDLRWTLSASVDYYPRSENYFPQSAVARRDLLERSAIGLWHTVFDDWQVSPAYEVTTRTSTSEPYSFVDHRFLARLVWNFDTDQYSVVPQGSRVPMEWSSGERRNRAREESRIQDLVRQDDAVKRGSSCLK